MELVFIVLLLTTFLQMSNTSYVKERGYHLDLDDLIRTKRNTLGENEGIPTEQTMGDRPTKPINKVTITANATGDFPSAARRFPSASKSFPPGYNKHVIPKHKSGRPMEVLLQMNVRKILDLDENEETMKFDLEFRIFWTDYHIRDHINNQRVEEGLERLSYNDMTPEMRKNMSRTLNDPLMLDKLWKPNLFFENVLKVSQPYPMARPVTVKLIPEIGALEYLIRLIVTTDCPLDYHYYPSDTQECTVMIRDFSYTEKDVKLSWFKTAVWLHELEVGSFDSKVDPPGEFKKKEDDEDPLTDSFQVFYFDIKLRRQLSFHIVQTFIPSTFYIVITCLCFLLPSRYVEARIGIAMTTLLTLTAMFASVRESTPVVSYVKALDIWMVGCIFFVFLTLAEFTFITWLKSIKEDYLESLNKKTDDVSEVEMTDLMNRKNSHISHVIVRIPKNVQMYENLMIFLERHNFPIFITILVVYSITYWVWLLISSDYFDWTIDQRYNNVDEEPW